LTPFATLSQRDDYSNPDCNAKWVEMEKIQVLFSNAASEERTATMYCHSDLDCGVHVSTHLLGNALYIALATLSPHPQTTDPAESVVAASKRTWAQAYFGAFFAMQMLGRLLGSFQCPPTHA